ncbi:hypothetical protein I3760_03G039800 [Carya illinoinensis]|nr:hypothetical protein I3760_03G039800 [Carya illinoinensis]
MDDKERDFDSPHSDGSPNVQKNKKKKRLFNEAEEVCNDVSARTNKKKKKKRFLVEAGKAEDGQELNGESLTKEEEEHEVNGIGLPVEENSESDIERASSRKNKRKKRLLKEIAAANRRGVCYLSRIPPHMDHVTLRQILSQFGELQRIYLTPENPTAQAHRKRAGKFQQQVFSEGWVEFTDKRVAKRVANMLNGEQIGGRKRSSFYYDLWNIKYLSKFKWDDLTAEIAYKSAVREQKLALEISAAKKERDFYLSKVDKSRALNSIERRLEKKQKLKQGVGMNSELPVSQRVAKVIRHFPQKQPVADNGGRAKPQLSKDILGGVFGGS